VLKPGAERREIATLFTDIAGFTALHIWQHNRRPSAAP